MTVDELRATLRDAAPPLGLDAPLKALWLAGRGDWDGAHAIVQDVDSPAAAWVHAYLHRREGDASNAAYWYRVAAKPVCTISFENEWTELARSLLAAQRK